MQEPSKEYLKGFNSGYVIAQYEPELAQQLSQTPDKKSDFFKGFSSGAKEYKQEKSKPHGIKSKIPEKGDWDIDREKE